MECTLDGSKVAEEEKCDGCYAVATNLLDPTKDILDVFRKRYQIENRFRIMKTSFDSKPVDHRLPERIRAHFLICFTALPVHHLMEVKLDERRTHVTVNDLIITLKNVSVADIRDIEYMALCNGGRALDALTQLTPLPLDRIHYRPKELNGIIKKL